MNHPPGSSNSCPAAAGRAGVPPLGGGAARPKEAGRYRLKPVLQRGRRRSPTIPEALEVTRGAILLAVLALPGPAFALQRIILGNERVGPEIGGGPEALAALNVDERVFLRNHEGALDAYFKGNPK